MEEKNMAHQLTKAERAFMEIFRHYGVKADEVLLSGHIYTAVYKKKLLSVPDRDRYIEIIQSLISKGYAYKKGNDLFQEGDDLFLTEEGETYIYG
jgi:glycyl-tRNA synthetase alpha subunit